ncbi:MAG: TetR/AcrR family transcriptional regulator [Xenophilus sp.]
MGRARSFDRDDVLDRAVDIFWERGYDGTGIQEICRVTGLNPGSVYAAFSDKHGLFIEALKRYMAVVSSQAIERLNGSPSGRAGIAGYYEALINAMVDGKRQWGCLVTNSIVEFAMRDPQISEAFQLHLARLETAFASAIERAKQEGELAFDVNAGETASFLVCTAQGLNVLAKTRPGRKVLDAIARQALTAVGFS